MQMYEGAALEIAKYIGDPVNPNLPVPVEIQALADVYVVEPGEKAWYYASQDTDDDEIYQVNTSTGALTAVKRSPMDVTELTFQGLNSKKEYVLLDSVLASPDVDILGRKKERIAQAMDKLELRLILKAITDSSTVQTVTKDSGEDLYDVIMQAKHKLEDYGDKFILLAGTDVAEAIDTYDKDQAATLNYNVNLKGKLTEMGVEVVKVFGVVKYTGDSVATELMDKQRFILIARNSRIAQGKPIAFVRRKVSPQVAAYMGAEVNNVQRALIVDRTPINVGGTDTLGYGVVAYESIIWAITNINAICKCTADVV